MTTLIFVRHGQSQANLARVFTGHSDIPLTELGLRQAENTATFLHDYPIERVYASDLTRAMQTAEPTARDHGLEVIPSRGMREIFAGKWEGNTFERLLEIYGKDYEAWIHDCGRAHPDGGESVVELSHRIYAEFDRLVAENRGRCIAVFSHATPIRLLCARWQGVPVEELSRVAWVPNASVSVVDIDEQGDVHVRLLGYDAHQGELSTSLAKGIV